MDSTVVVDTIFSRTSITVTVVGLLTLYLLRKLKQRAARNKIQSAASAKIAEAVKERDDRIEWAKKEAAKVSDDERTRIEAMDFQQLREALQSGSVTAEVVVRVYYGLAVRSHVKTNCLTNVIKKSLEDARQLDVMARDPSYKKPPLFGLPLSVKECIDVKGERSTWGLVQRSDCIAREDSCHVVKLRMEGMIPFCKTNNPTMCMTYICENAIYGSSCSPYSSSRTSGGSSGGEGALIGSQGSILGLGSDLGGSVRIPATYSGCCAFKPSATRFTNLDYPEPIPFRPFCMPSDGPLAQDPHAIVAFMRAIWSDLFISNYDALAVPIDFRDDLFKEGTRYRIGYYSTDDYIDPLPGNQRVVREAVELLKSKDHTLIPFTLGEIVPEAARGIWGTVYAEGGKRQAEILKDEPLSQNMELLRSYGRKYSITKRCLGWISRLRGDEPTADFFHVQSTKASDVQKGIDRIYACRKRVIQKMKEENIDLILCPSTLSPSLPHASPHQMPFTAMMNTMMWNAMDFPAGVVTTGNWTEEDEAALASYEEKGLVQKTVKKACKASVGLPLSVQIVAPSFRDEMVLRVMVDLYEAVKAVKK